MVISFLLIFLPETQGKPMNESIEELCNKNDIEDGREGTKEEGEEFAQKNNLIYLETSAKNNNNVEKLFDYFTFKLIQYYENNKEKYIWNDTDETSGRFSDIRTNIEEKKKCAC